MSLIIEGLKATVNGKEVLKGVDLEVRPGEVHALMGPNGSGKSTLGFVLMGRPGYEVVSGSVRLDGQEILDIPTHERARLGLFLTFQYPVEIPGVTLDSLAHLRPPASSFNRSEEQERLGLSNELVERSLNVGLSGGEKKRLETIQFASSSAGYLILDEIDSGLDVEGLDVVASRVEEASLAGCGVLAITHYKRLFELLNPDAVHVFVDGKVVYSGEAGLARELEKTGYATYRSSQAVSVRRGSGGADPFADPLA